MIVPIPDVPRGGLHHGDNVHVSNIGFVSSSNVGMIASRCTYTQTTTTTTKREKERKREREKESQHHTQCTAHHIHTIQKHILPREYSSTVKKCILEYSHCNFSTSSCLTSRLEFLTHLYAALMETSNVGAHDGCILVRGHPSPRRRRIVRDDLCIQQLSLDVADGYARGWWRRGRNQ